MSFLTFCRRELPLCLLILGRVEGGPVMAIDDDDRAAVLARLRTRFDRIEAMLGAAAAEPPDRHDLATARPDQPALGERLFRDARRAQLNRRSRARR